MSHTLTKRSQRHQALMQRELHRASVLHGPAQVRALRCVARHCLHLGQRELAQKARQLARCGNCGSTDKAQESSCVSGCTASPSPQACGSACSSGADMPAKQGATSIRPILGRRYNRAKKTAGGQEGNANAAKNEVAKVTSSNTSEKLAKEHGVSKNTVERA